MRTGRARRGRGERGSLLAPTWYMPRPRHSMDGAVMGVSQQQPANILPSHIAYTDAFLLFAVPVSHCRKRTGKFSFEPVCLLVYGSCFYSVCIRLILLILRKKVRHKGGHQKNSLEKFLVKNVHFYFCLIVSKDPKGEHQRSPYVLACLEIKSDVTFGLSTNPTFTLS